jgi:hypothetical protein
MSIELDVETELGCHILSSYSEIAQSSPHLRLFFSELYFNIILTFALSIQINFFPLGFATKMLH